MFAIQAWKNFFCYWKFQGKIKSRICFILKHIFMYFMHYVKPSKVYFNVQTTDHYMTSFLYQFERQQNKSNESTCFKICFYIHYPSFINSSSLSNLRRSKLQLILWLNVIRRDLVLAKFRIRFSLFKSFNYYFWILIFIPIEGVVGSIWM